MYIDFEKDDKNKHKVLREGNQHTSLQFLDITAEAMNKEEKIAMY